MRCACRSSDLRGVSIWAGLNVGSDSFHFEIMVYIDII